MAHRHLVVVGGLRTAATAKKRRRRKRLGEFMRQLTAACPLSAREPANTVPVPSSSHFGGASTLHRVCVCVSAWRTGTHASHCQSTRRTPTEALIAQQADMHNIHIYIIGGATAARHGLRFFSSLVGARHTHQQQAVHAHWMPSK